MNRHWALLLMADLCKTSFSPVLVLRPAKPAPQPLHLLQLRYGAPDTAPAESHYQ